MRRISGPPDRCRGELPMRPCDPVRIRRLGRGGTLGRVTGRSRDVENALVADVVDVILRDGSTLRLRPPTRADADAILDFFRALSEQSIYMRFHGFPSLGPRGRRAGARLRLGGARCAPRLVRRGRDGARGRARELRAAPRPVCCRGAFAVADAYQRRGIGTRLVEQLAERAAHHGIERFVARRAARTTAGCSASSRRSASS